MTILWACDRCGQTVNAREVGGNSNGGWRIGKDCMSLNMTVDLCPDCIEGLRAYLRGEDL